MTLARRGVRRPSARRYTTRPVEQEQPVLLLQAAMAACGNDPIANSSPCATTRCRMAAPPTENMLIAAAGPGP
jgi:hypothetical protein